MRSQAEVPVRERRISLVEQDLERQEVLSGLRHLPLLDHEELAVHPILHPRLLAERALCLRDLVRVMDGDVVDAACMQVELLAEVLRGHR